ncbi:hypothetical protein ABZP36_006724 [Zizania latifolia]
MTEEDIGMMLLIDGCFIVHFLLRHYPKKGAEHEYWSKLDAGFLDQDSGILNPPMGNALGVGLGCHLIPFIAVRILFDILTTEHDKDVNLTASANNMFNKRSYLFTVRSEIVIAMHHRICSNVLWLVGRTQNTHFSCVICKRGRLFLTKEVCSRRFHQVASGCNPPCHHN